jgi:hypothetical protein
MSSQMDPAPNIRGKEDLYSSYRSRSTTKTKPRSGQTEADRVRGESSLWRALQVIGIILVVTTVGGWGASAR